MNIASERHALRGGKITTNGIPKGRILLKKAETRNQQNNSRNTVSSSHPQKRTILKVVVRLLPPDLDEQDFFSQVQEYVNERTTDDMYYIKGEYSNIPFQLPTFSRAYILFKDENNLNEFMPFINNFVFKNSNGIREEESYTPTAEISFYDKMDFPKKDKLMKPIPGALENDPVFKKFLAWYNTEESLEKALNRPSSFIKILNQRKPEKISKRKEPLKKKNTRDSKKAKGQDDKKNNYDKSKKRDSKPGTTKAKEFKGPEKTKRTFDPSKLQSKADLPDKPPGSSRPPPKPRRSRKPQANNKNEGAVKEGSSNKKMNPSTQDKPLRRATPGAHSKISSNNRLEDKSSSRNLRAEDKSPLDGASDKKKETFKPKIKILKK